VTLLKVSSRSNPNAVAGAFAGVVREQGRAEVCVIGAGALNQAVKAVAIARGYFEEQGIDLVCVPTFCELEIDGELRTGLQLLIEDRARRGPDAWDGHARHDGHREVRLDDLEPLSVDPPG
jgi:stage V sporulation protein S